MAFIRMGTKRRFSKGAADLYFYPTVRHKVSALAGLETLQSPDDCEECQIEAINAEDFCEIACHAMEIAGLPIDAKTVNAYRAALKLPPLE